MVGSCYYGVDDDLVVYGSYFSMCYCFSIVGFVFLLVNILVVILVVCYGYSLIFLLLVGFFIVKSMEL